MRWLTHALLLLLLPAAARAGVGDPQVGTDHPWYPGELACSTFDRLFATQAAVYQRVTSRDCTTDEDKALAAWLWRNTHYWHGEEGAEDLWGQGFAKGQDVRTREYWTGLFAHGFGLCGTTHCQWVAEMEARLGHGRGRAVGAAGHSAFEVFLKGGIYGDGKWVLLDHDLSTVVFDPAGRRLLGMREITPDWKRLTDRTYKAERQRGWLICGLHPNDNASYAEFAVAEYLAGYAGPPPMVYLRRGETLRRYLQPGLEDGKTFVFWGRNYRTGGVPGPERSLTWVNQPDAMFRSKTGTRHNPGQARFANAVYTYTPDFASGDYKEGVVSEDDGQVTFEFRSPYIIAATPAKPGDWGVYEPGCTNGLVVHGKGTVTVSASIDRGTTWSSPASIANGADLTDVVKGHRQYWLKVRAGAKALAARGLTMTTVCQANASTMPRLADGGSTVTFAASGRALVSAGPTLPQVRAHVAEGAFGTPRVTLELATPRGEPVVAVYAAAHLNSGNPPDPKVKYQVEMSTDDGMTWRPVVKDWTINRPGDEPADFWSQSFCWGTAELPAGFGAKVRVRFRNDGGKAVARAELHLAYAVPRRDPTEVTFTWSDDAGDHTSSHRFTETAGDRPWAVPTGNGVRTRWVELKPAP
ncbi:MAG TPA: hypothetical protein VKD90_26795 [Gemmataceae bacterium]|nr:hypothetical protein [Gemmataceae bacterium]